MASLRTETEKHDMASIRFELSDSEGIRRELGALGEEFSTQHGRIVVFFPGVPDSEALFLLVKGVTGHGMKAALDDGHKEEAALLSKAYEAESHTAQKKENLLPHKVEVSKANASKGKSHA